jgi:hypothetical protein
VRVAFVAVRLRTWRMFVQRVPRMFAFPIVVVAMVVVPKVVVAAVSEEVAMREPAVSVGTVRAWMLRFVMVVVASDVVPTTARFPVVVRFEAVDDARVEDPVAKRLLRVAVPAIVVEPAVTERRVPFCAVKLAIVVEAKVEEPVARRFCVLVVVALVVLAFSVVIFPVVVQRVVMVAKVEVSVLMKPVANDAIPPVTLVTVVEAKVLDPVTRRLPAVAVPAIVEEPAVSDVTAPCCAVKFWRVVLARVVEPTTWRDEVAMREPAMRRPCAVVEASDADEVAMREPIVA